MSIFKSEKNTFQEFEISPLSSVVGMYELVHEFHSIVIHSIATGLLIVVEFTDADGTPVHSVDITKTKKCPVLSTHFRLKIINTVSSTNVFSVLTFLSRNQVHGDENISSLTEKLPPTLGVNPTSQSLCVCFPVDFTGLIVKPQQYGDYGNVANNVTLLPSGYTSSLDISKYAYAFGFYSDLYTGFAGTTIAVELSVDGSNFFPSSSSLYPYSSGDTVRRSTFYRLDVSGINFLRFRNTSTTETIPSVTASVFGASM